MFPQVSTEIVVDASKTQLVRSHPVALVVQALTIDPDCYVLDLGFAVGVEVLFKTGGQREELTQAAELRSFQICVLQSCTG